VLLGTVIFLAVGAVIFVFRPYSSGTPPAIPQGWGFGSVQKFIGTPARPEPVAAPTVPLNPHLARGNSSNMHVDSYASDAHPSGGPLGIHPVVRTYAHGSVGGECACVTFDSRGNIVAVCATFKEFSLMLLSPRDLRPLTRLPLPPRESNKSMNLRKIMSDTSGGAYFFLDAQDRAVLVDAKQHLKVVAQRWSGDVPAFHVEKDIDLRPSLAANGGSDDAITAILPDWDGRYWFVTRGGLVGVLSQGEVTPKFLRLQGEQIQNSFAVDESGVFIVSDHALYGVQAEAEHGAPLVAWREPYDRGTTRKLGMISVGSGTTPTLLGSNLVAIADNAEPTVNVLVYRRGMTETKPRLLLRMPVFAPGASATENSLIGIGNSLIVENNYGYDIFTTMMFGRTGAGGLTRIDFSPDTGEAVVKWHNPIISQTTVPKLSMETGLIYVYAKNPAAGAGIDAYYLAAVDFHTGKTVFQVLAGTGVSFDNNWAPITLGPDRAAYIGVLRGLVKVYDGGQTE